MNRSAHWFPPKDGEPHYWIRKLTNSGIQLLHNFGIKRAYPKIKLSNHRKPPEQAIEPVICVPPPMPLIRKKPEYRIAKPLLIKRGLMTTNTNDFRKLLENMPANISELARLSSVHERTIMRMRDGESVLRGTANKVLRGLSQIYGQAFTLDNVAGINIYDK